MLGNKECASELRSLKWVLQSNRHLRNPNLSFLNGTIFDSTRDSRRMSYETAAILNQNLA